MSTGPLFDSTHAALKFALNYEVATPRPVMNRMQADGSLQRVELEDGRRVTAGAAMRKKSREHLKGLDGAAQAAMIARQLDLLTSAQKHAIVAGFKTWVLPCACRNPCCMGYRKNPGWLASINALCEILKEDAQISRIRGRRGLSTHPVMRLALVEKFFIPEKTMVLAELAEKCHVTQQTVIAHRRPIEEFLTKVQGDGLEELDLILYHAGIVGQFD